MNESGGIHEAAPRALLIRGARQLLTLHGPAGPRRGAALRELGIITDGAVLVRDGLIEEVGVTRRVENLAAARGALEIDAGGRVVMPGFVDSHTHLIHGVPWLDDYEARILGANPLEAMTGWRDSLHALHTTSTRRLEAAARLTLEGMARHGTTTVEAKCGYGCDAAAETKVLRVLAKLDQKPLEVLATYFAVAPLLPSGRGRPSVPDLDGTLSQTLPALARRRLARFADIFVDAGDAALAAAGRYLDAARGLGFLLKVHTDQFSHTGGVPLAVHYGAVSADHLEYASADDIAALARSETIATLLPGSAFHLRSGRAAPARALVDAGAAVALASNFNPNTSPSYNMQMVLSLACAQLGLTPAEAISAATVNGAHALRRADAAGSLELGKWGDILVLNVSDYREIPYYFGINTVHTTIQRGRIVSREGAVG